MPDDAMVVRWAHSVARPWKDGGGITRELMSAPAGASASAFDWRISIADIEQSGGFSLFPGIDRAFTLIEGDALILTVDGIDHEVPLHAPFMFSGDSTITCTVRQGRARALNVMTRAGRCRAEVAVVALEGRRRLTRSADHGLVLLPLSGDMTVSRPHEDVRLTAYDLMRVGTSVEVRGTGECAVVGITGW